MSNGYVYLIGAGPGDPELLTQKAVRALTEADVIIYDYLANDKILDYCKAEAEYIYVGKQAGNHTMKQEDINALLVQKGCEGHTVARLKGGDPYVFGRGGEEAADLREAGVGFEIIPGITSAIAGPSYAGIPVTHRGVARSFHVMTGHFKDDYAEWDWEALHRLDGTLIFLMGIGHVKRITEALIEAGKPADTPAAVIRWATYPIQKTVTGTLENLSQRVQDEGIKPPGIIVVGPVVNCREQLSTFENRPLFGKRIVVTRARAQAGRLSQGLERLGAEVIELPMIRIQERDLSQWKQTIDDINTYTWLVFTSANAVQTFFGGLSESGLDTRSLGHLKVACIGSGTMKALKGHGLVPDLMPERAISESLAEALTAQLGSHDNVLVPSGNLASNTLQTEIESVCNIDMPVVYDTVIEEASPERLREVLETGIDAVTFTSASTAKNFHAMLEKADQTWPQVKSFSIGPKTTEALAAFDIDPIESENATIDGLIHCIMNRLVEN